MQGHKQQFGKDLVRGYFLKLWEESVGGLKNPRPDDRSLSWKGWRQLPGLGTREGYEGSWDLQWRGSASPGPARKHTPGLILLLSAHLLPARASGWPNPMGSQTSSEFLAAVSPGSSPSRGEWKTPAESREWRQWDSLQLWQLRNQTSESELGLHPHLAGWLRTHGLALGSLVSSLGVQPPLQETVRMKQITISAAPHTEPQHIRNITSQLTSILSDDPMEWTSQCPAVLRISEVHLRMSITQRAAVGEPW